MLYRIRKQVTILFIVGVFLIFVGTVIYYAFLKPGPTCYDRIRNQDEEEIDCGGLSCISCEIKTLKQIEIIWAEAIPVAPNLYDLAAKIKNPNPNFGTSYVKYEFELKNQSGQSVGIKSGSTFILPNSSKYIIENNIENQSQIVSVELRIDTGDPLTWEKLKDYQAPELYIKDKKFETPGQGEYYAQASGVVKNGTNFGFDTVDINIILFDSNSEPIGAAKSKINTLTAAEDRYFSIRWFYPISSQVKSFDIQAETNLFFDDNYMQIYGVPKEQ
ncbi:MAG TPA: hypothetical protein VJ624_01015 [Thermodesulfobacteriota bacterium]|nr:hypothetical protein [Thermodesulfobacteriota bacterium]